MYRHASLAALTAAATLGVMALAVAAPAAPPAPLAITSTGSVLDRSAIRTGPGNGTAQAVLEGGSFGVIAGSGAVTIPVTFSGNGPDSDVVHGSAVFTTGAGAFTLQFEALHKPFSVPLFDGRWVLEDGTGAYAGLHGTGTVEFDIAGEQTQTPIVDASWSGSAH